MATVPLYQITSWESGHYSRLIRVRHLACLSTHLRMLTIPHLGQGLLFSTAEILKFPLDLVRLWLHEAERVYGDKMVDEKDQDTLRRVTIASTKKFFDVSQATSSPCQAQEGLEGQRE